MNSIFGSSVYQSEKFLKSEQNTKMNFDIEQRQNLLRKKLENIDK
jgi:hypothetical protein